MIEAAVLRCLCLIENYENHGNMYLGELIEQGPTETIFTEPNDPRTKAYIEGAFG
jgi:ABC-type phosphate transport system ATPase subunit